jgi:hypothetical protein
MYLSGQIIFCGYFSKCRIQREGGGYVFPWSPTSSRERIPTAALADTESPGKQSSFSVLRGFPTAARVRRLRRIRQTLYRGICNSWLAQCVDFWGLLTRVSCTRSTVSVDGSGRPVRFAARMQPLCWNFLYHSAIILSVGGSVWFLARNLRFTITIYSDLANSKTQNAFLSPVLAMFRHDCPLAVKPAKYAMAPNI